jgi:hypothetical protein
LLKPGPENDPAGKNGKRADEDDSREKTAHLQTPKMSDKKRASQRTLSAIYLSKDKTFYYSLS